MTYGSDSNTIFVRRHFGWRIHVSGNGNGIDKDKGDDKDKGNVAFSHLPPRQAAWIILLHDLSVSWDSGRSITDNLVQKVRNSLDKPMDHEPGLKDSGWAWRLQEEEKDGGKRQIWEHLPVPNFHTFRQLDRFLAIWSDGLSNPGSESLTQLWERASSIAMGPDDRYDREILKIDK